MRNYLRVERAKRRLSQEDLGKAVNVSRHAIVGVETGRYEPTVELGMKIAKYFNKKVEDIFFLTDEDMPPL